ncbi:MAG: porphobilinogen synthase, partial [Planctomycetes bacterium]|nr:porphobilinogen synthase [Planctomycetota bacterium]
MNEPIQRYSRLRANRTLREMVQEHRLSRADLIQPIFIHHGDDIKNEIPSMPGQFQYSIYHAVDYAKRLYDLGIKAVLLFGIPAQKDAEGSDTWDDENGIIQQGLRQMRKSLPDDMVLITDVCFCEYTDHGHCGVIGARPDGTKELDNDASLENLARQVVSHAKHGADIVAPSGMLDGMVLTIREALDAAGHQDLPILSYAAKFASGFYGPFREVAESTPEFGDRAGYQMDPANADEALREVALDIDEGADMV